MAIYNHKLRTDGWTVSLSTPRHFLQRPWPCWEWGEDREHEVCLAPKWHRVFSRKNRRSICSFLNLSSGRSVAIDVHPIVWLEQLAGFLRFFLASFLGTVSNTPNFMVTSTKKFELHILASLFTWNICKKLQNSLVLDDVYIGLWEIANKRAFYTKFWENLWSEKNANPSGHSTLHSKCNFGKNFKPLWMARSSANELRVHIQIHIV